MVVVWYAVVGLIWSGTLCLAYVRVNLLTGSGPIGALAIDHLGGGVATVTAASTGDDLEDGKNQSATVSVWTFSHNNVSAPLADFY